jgi:hypothetical protein
MPRKSGNFLRAYELYTAESESPSSFHLLVGLSCISSAVRRNVWLNQGLYLLYPNIYVVLVSPPGRCGKSTAIRLGRRLLWNVPGVVIGPDSVTAEELIRELASTYADGQSAMTIHSTELSSLIEPSGIKMIQLLTDLYDADHYNPQGWRYSTKTQGRDVIRNPCLTLVAGTTPSYVSEGLTEAIVSHGFSSRVLFVFEERERFANPRPKEPPPELIAALEEDLVQISQIKGEFRWTEEALKMYDDYYRSLHESEPVDYRIEGYHFRKRIHVLKLAMLCSLSEKDELILTSSDIQAAIEILDLIEPKMARTFASVGKFEHSLDLERLHDQITAAGPSGLPLPELFRRNYFIGSLSELDEMISSLIVMGAAKKIRDEDGTVRVVPVTERKLWER